MTNFVSVEAKVLAKAMKLATAISEPRCTIPILGTVRLNYGSKGLNIEATDLDLTSRIDVDEIDGEGSWSICIDARQLASIASAAGVAPLRIQPAPEQTIEPDNKAVRQACATITAGEAAYEIQTLPADDFPDFVGDRMQRIERFTNGHFVAMLKKVYFCISTEETRYYLNGVNWSAKPQGKRFAATDGHRLALCRYAGNDNDADFSYIIPRKTVHILCQFFDGADIEIFSVGKGNVISETVLDIHASGVQLRTKLIDGNFPDIDRVIPGQHTHKLEIRRDEILNAIHQATAIGGWRGDAIRLHGAEGRLNIERKNVDVGTAKVATSSGWPEDCAAVGVNNRYFKEMIKSCQGDIELRMAEPGAPLTLSDGDTEMTRVLMPMRV